MPSVNIDDDQYRELLSFYTSAVPNVITGSFLSRLQHDHKVNLVIEEDINALTRDLLRSYCLQLFAELLATQPHAVAVNPSLAELADPAQHFTTVFTTSDAPELTQRVIAAGGVVSSDAGMDAALRERFSAPFIAFPAHTPWARPQVHTPLPDEAYRAGSLATALPSDGHEPLQLQTEDVLATFPPLRERENADATAWARGRMKQLLQKQPQPHPRGPAFEQQMASCWQAAGAVREGKGPAWEALNAPVDLDACGGVWRGAAQVSLPLRQSRRLQGIPPVLHSAELVAASRSWPPRVDAESEARVVTPAEHLAQAPALREGVGLVGLRAHPLSRKLAQELWKLYSITTQSQGVTLRQYLGQLKAKSRK